MNLKNYIYIYLMFRQCVGQWGYNELGYATQAFVEFTVQWMSLV